MSSTQADERAEKLATEALGLVDNDQLRRAANAVKEAISIAPENVHVKDAFARVRAEEQKSPIVRLCNNFVHGKDAAAGREALRAIAASQVSIHDAETLLCLLLIRIKEERELAGQLLTEVLKQQSSHVGVAKKFQQSPTEIFQLTWDYGDDSVSAIVLATLNSNAWPSEGTQKAAQRDVLLLLLAKLLEPGQDHEERALRGIARLLALGSPELAAYIDVDSFDAILTLLDIRLHVGLRSQATLTTAKFLEAQPERARTWFSKFVTSRAAKQTNDDLIVALSACAAIFPIAPSAAATLFLTPTFAEQLPPVVKKSKSTRLEQAVLELLNAACIDRACREAISKYCKVYLRSVVDEASDPARAGLAAVILVKINANPTEAKKVSDAEKGSDDLVSLFKDMMLHEDEQSRKSSIEGLAYTSLQPKVKKMLANDAQFLKNLINTLSKFATDGPLTFGGLSILANLTAYPPLLSEEQKRLTELKAYANTSKPGAPNPLEDDEHVTARCRKVLDAGVVPLLVGCIKTAQKVTSMSQIVAILLSLSKDQKHRAKLTQQGAVRLLVSIYASLSTSNADKDASVLHIGAHALARILISANPSHVFTSALPITSAIRPLVLLLSDRPAPDLVSSEEATHSFLPVFEALLALTNLASTSASSELVPKALLSSSDTTSVIDDLLLHKNVLVQRASLELLCNLCASPPGAAHCAEKKRLHVILALAGSEDEATRKAAGGALAMVSEWDEGVRGILGREGGLKVVLEMLDEGESEEVVFRGTVVVRNLVCAPEDMLRETAVERVKKEAGVEVLRGALARTRHEGILQAGFGALKQLR